MLMKTSLHSMTRTVGTAVLAALSLLAFTPDSQAKDKDDKRGSDKSRHSWFNKRGNVVKISEPGGLVTAASLLIRGPVSG